MPAPGPRLAPLDMLARLVAFDTESSKSNLALIDFVADYLAGRNVPHVRVPNADGTKAAIFATVGPTDRGGVVLSGHTDVVPVAGQAWTSDPFTLRVRTAALIARRRRHEGLRRARVGARAGFPGRRPRNTNHILLSYDEETTCLGPTDTIARFGRDLPMPKAVIVGEPTGLDVVDAHKSVVTFNSAVHGHEAHSAKPMLGADAIAAAAELVCELNRIGDEMVARGDATGRFDPPYTTIHVGTISGGTARNILPKICTFHWEFRGLPDLDPQEIPARLDRFAHDVALKRLNRHGPFGRIETAMEVSVPGLAPDPGSLAERFVWQLAGRNRTTTVPFATKSGHFQAAGLPTVVCGPGSIDQAHQPDEYITLDDLAAGEAFMRRLAAACAQGTL